MCAKKALPVAVVLGLLVSLLIPGAVFAGFGASPAIVDCGDLLAGGTFSSQITASSSTNVDGCWVVASVKEGPLQSWITFPAGSQILFPPGETRCVVPLAVEVPESTEPGFYTGVIYLSRWPLDAPPSGVGVITGVAVQVWVNVLPPPDNLAPTTVAALTGAAGSNGWYRSDVEVSLTAADNEGGVGVAATEFSLDGVNWTDYVAPVLVSQEGESTFYYRSIDILGNQEETQSVMVKIDRTPPALVGKRMPGPNVNGWNNTFVLAYFIAEDALSGVISCSSPVTLTDEGVGQEVTGYATDMAGNTAGTTVDNVNIDLTPPVITVVSPEAYAVAPVGMSLDFSAADGLSGLVTFEATLDNGTSVVSVDSGTSPGPGIYILRVVATDMADNRAEVIRQFVVYDPNGGFVTGGGWINSPAGAYAARPDLAGKVNFGFASKYRKIGEVPVGQTKFEFEAAGWEFISTNYDWLVIAGSKAQFGGKGTINEEGGYAFLLTAVDGSPDQFRIRIWEEATGIVVYDNGVDSNLGKGSIILHK